MKDPLKTLLDKRGVLLADGAIGTNLFAAGLETGDSPELWNVEHPDRVEALHRSFVEAGSDIILTNSFGGTHFRLALHGAGHRVAELNMAAARLARRAAESRPTPDRPGVAGEHDFSPANDTMNEGTGAGRRVLVAGSIGPTGEILEPNGTVSIAAAAEAFAEQAQALAEGGVDLLWLETLSSAEEIEAAVGGASGCGLPIVCTVSIDTNGRTMMGLTAADTIRVTAELGTGAADIMAVGSNCGVGAAELVAAIVNLGNAARASGVAPLLVAKANCGIPTWQEGRIVYDGTPELMGDYARLASDAGARIIGGCCGTSPAHIAAMRAALDAHTPGETPTADAIVARLGEISQGARAQLGGDLSLEGGSASGRGSRGSRRLPRR